MIHQLTITYDDQTGITNVNGPVDNKGICYLMLECARDAVKDHVDKAQSAIIVPEVGNGRGGFVRRIKRK